MKQLSQRSRAWVKGFHIFFSCAWVGTGLSMLLLAFLRSHAPNGDELFAFNEAIKLLDDYIIIPAAFGSLITGLLFSLYTNWGFFKYKWVIFKWVATLAQIIFGTFWLGPWTNEATAISDVERILALQNPAYLHDKLMNSIFGSAQVALLIAQVFISVTKPWGKRGSK